MKKQKTRAINLASSSNFYKENIMETPIDEDISDDILANDTLLSTIKKLNDKIDYLMGERDKVFLMDDIKKEIISNIQQIVEDTIKEKLNDIIFMVSTIQEKNAKEKNRFSNLKLYTEDDELIPEDHEMNFISSTEEEIPLTTNGIITNYHREVSGVDANIGEQTTINFGETRTGTITTTSTSTSTSTLNWYSGHTYFDSNGINLWAVDTEGTHSNTNDKQKKKRSSKKSSTGNIPTEETIIQQETVTEQINYHKNIKNNESI